MSRFGRLFMAAALLASASVAAAVPAGAAAKPKISCATSTGTVTVTPGLTTQKQARTLSSTTTYSKCTGGGKVTKGVGKATEHLKPGTCLDLAKSGLKQAFSTTITWNTKQTSTVTGTAVTGAKTVVTITGTVTAGLYKGAKFTTKDLFMPKKGQTCTAKQPGIKNLTQTGKAPMVIK